MPPKNLFYIPTLQDKIAENMQTYIDVNKGLQFPVETSFSDRLSESVNSQYNSPEDIERLKEQGYQFKTRFNTFRTLSGGIQAFSENYVLDPNGNEIQFPGYSTSAFDESLKHQPTSDASENWANNLMAGGLGLFRAYGTGAAQNLIKSAQNRAPKLSFSSAYNNAAWIPYADAAFNASFGVPAAYDIGVNGLNWVNGTDLGLSMLPVFGPMYNPTSKLLSKTVTPNGLKLGNNYYKK